METPWPSVSVIVPTRDRPQLLRAAIECIVQQDYPGAIEILVVFDQSDPVELLPGPVSRRVQAITNARTPGLAGARNTGILAACGELIAFCDDDDEWRPDKLRKQVEALRRFDSVSVVCTGIVVAYGDRVSPRVLDSDTVVFKDLLRSRMMECHPSTFLARRGDVLGPIGLVDEDIPGSYYEDYEWLLRASRVGPIRAIREPLVRVRWHESSYFVDRWSTIIAAIEYLLAKYPALHTDDQGIARLYGQLAFACAAAGRPAEARRWSLKSLKRNWRERRAYVAIAVSSRFLGADTVLRFAHDRGRGI